MNFSNNTQLVITTRGRTDFQPTLRNLAPELRRCVTLVCYPGERKQHIHNWGGKVDAIIEHPTQLTHLGQIRTWCIEHLSSNRNVILIDDNLNFHARISPDHGEGCEYPLIPIIEKHFTKNTITRIQQQMFMWIVQQLNTNHYGIVGVSQRSGNHNVRVDFLENTRTYALWAVNKKLYNQIAPHYYTQFPSKNDFCLALEFLTAGIPTIVTYQYAFGKQGGANNKGGCSVYRTVKLFNDATKELKQLFPAFVTIRQKSTKSWRGAFKDNTLDATIKWKKAYKYGKYKNKGFFS